MPVDIVVLFVLNDLRLEDIACFADIGGTVDHHCLNFLVLLILVELLTITV
jgi:hypothetical protein